jgi:hypothetical protein
MTIDDRVAKEVGKAIMDAIGLRLWEFVDAEIKKQLEATEHLYGFLEPGEDGKFYASVGLYGNEADEAKVAIVLNDIKDCIGPNMDEYSIKMARMQINGMRALAAEAIEIAGEAEKYLNRCLQEQNKDRT